MWILSQKVSQYPGCYHWSETLLLAALCRARGRYKLMLELRVSFPAFSMLQIFSSCHSSNLEKGGIQKADLGKDKEQNLVSKSYETESGV